MTLGLRRRNGVQRLVSVARHRARLLVQRRLPDGQTERVLDVDERLSLLDGYRILFVVLFLFACLMINASQLVVILPLRLFPFRRARKLYYEGVRYTKGAFGALLGAFLNCLNAAEGRGI